MLFVMMPIRGAALRLHSESLYGEIANDVGRNHNAPIEIAQTNDCFTLSMGGFPLPSKALAQELGSKEVYFKHLKSLGYDESLHVVQRGTVEKFDECLGI
jgi:hypothetical protein